MLVAMVLTWWWLGVAALGGAALIVMDWPLLLAMMVLVPTAVMMVLVSFLQARFRWARTALTLAVGSLAPPGVSFVLGPSVPSVFWRPYDLAQSSEVLGTGIVLLWSPVSWVLALPLVLPAIVVWLPGSRPFFPGRARLSTSG